MGFLSALKSIGKKYQVTKKPGTSNNSITNPSIPIQSTKIANQINGTKTIQTKQDMKDSLSKLKAFIITPTGVAVIIGLIVVAWYALKGHKNSK